MAQDTGLLPGSGKFSVLSVPRRKRNGGQGDGDGFRLSGEQAGAVPQQTKQALRERQVKVVIVYGY